eukprot:TRINITY_DN1525_c0_g1_i1.p1 TRINITY_DN1525_c0_g1~~TRINITY_DN1525_c0_g1_i1.p1  ORF type:complete len:218 (+),score=-4.96 TRINITY_DN1525_c0_g1_i1:634-1287(+)
MNIIIKTTNTKQSCLNSIKSMEKIQNLRGTQTPHQHKNVDIPDVVIPRLHTYKLESYASRKGETKPLNLTCFILPISNAYDNQLYKYHNLQTMEPTVSVSYNTQIFTNLVNLKKIRFHDCRTISQTWQTQRKYVFTTVEQFRELAKLLGNTFSQKSNDFSQFRKYVIGKQTIKVLPVVYEIITMQTLNKTLTKNQPTPLNLLYKTVLYTKLNLLIIS